MIWRVKGLDVLKGEELVQINPEDADNLGIEDGEQVRVISRSGEVIAKASVTRASPVGAITMSLHFSEARMNPLTEPGPRYRFYNP